MRKLTYDPINGTPIADGLAEEWVKSFLSHIEIVDTISTQLPIDILRRMIAEKELDCNEVAIFFEGKQVIVNHYGAIVDWPRGFCDKDTSVCFNILEAAMKQRKEERAQEKKDNE